MYPFERIKGIAFQDEKTKRLVERLPPKKIAVVVHQDIDTAAAQMLINCSVKAVVNLQTSMSGLFSHNGVELLLKANIPVFDIEEQKSTIQLEGKLILIKDHYLFEKRNDLWEKRFRLKQYGFKDIKILKEKAETLFPKQFRAFVGNSIYYGKKELDPFLSQSETLPILRQFLDKNVLVVARGADYQDDLLAVNSMLKKKNLISIAVDGGADGLLAIGVRPDVIIGDMDSVSATALKCGARLMVHTYQDGRAPGEARVASMGLHYERISLSGTSEDAAIVYAYCSGAKRIYTVGTRIGMNEFLEKGRIGMGSSLLTRMKVGHVLVDLKGIHTLVEKKQSSINSPWFLLPALVAGMILSFNQRFDLFVSLFLQWWRGG